MPFSEHVERKGFITFHVIAIRQLLSNYTAKAINVTRC